MAKDVARTDRDDPFYADINHPNLQMLNDVLCTWCMYNFDLGYVQGMSDILAVILRVVQDEVEAFWCFVGLMDTLHKLQANFSADQVGISEQLEDLRKLVRFVDPSLMDYLEKNEAANLFFVFRWLLIVFKREFEFEDIQTLWEALWSGHYSHKFHMFVCLGMVNHMRGTILDRQLNFDGLLAYTNGLTGSYDLDFTLGMAESIYKHIAAQPYLPPRIRELLNPYDPATLADLDPPPKKEQDLAKVYYQWEDGKAPGQGEWRTYSDDTMGEIMKLRKSRQSMGEIVVQGTPHHVDLEVMMQTNTQTGHVNAMREVVERGGGGAKKAAGAAPQAAVPASPTEKAAGEGAAAAGASPANGAAGGGAKGAAAAVHNPAKSISEEWESVN